MPAYDGAFSSGVTHRGRVNRVEKYLEAAISNNSGVPVYQNLLGVSDNRLYPARACMVLVKYIAASSGRGL